MQSLLVFPPLSLIGLETQLLWRDESFPVWVPHVVAAQSTDALSETTLFGLGKVTAMSERSSLHQILQFGL